MIQLAILALSIIPHDVALRDSVSVLEIQHYYDGEGREIFSQLIGWDESDNVRFWRMAKTEQHIPKRDWANGGYAVTFSDGDQLRTIAAPSFRETWGQEDVELANRTILPSEHRRPLRVGGK